MSDWTAFPPAARAEILHRQKEMQAYIDGLLVGAGVDTVGQTVEIHETGLAWRVKPQPPAAGQPITEPDEPAVAGI